VGEFIGIFRRGGSPVDAALIGRLSNTLAGVDRARVWRGDGVALVHRAGRSWEIADAAGQPSEQPGGRVVVADALLDAPDELATSLGLASRRAPGNGALVAAACARWGGDAARHLIGPFAFALWDAGSVSLTLARDPLGAKSLFYVEHGGDVFFASAMLSLLALPMVSRDIDELVLARMLTIDRYDQERTLYRHIRPVPPGGMAVFADGSSRVTRYWSAEDILPVRFRRDADYVDAGRALLDQAVASRIRNRADVAVTLSGGLDSAGVAATSARLRAPGRVTAYHRAPGASHPYRDALDERPLVEDIARLHSNLDLRVIDDGHASRHAAEPEAEAPYTQLPHLGGVNTRWFESLIDAIAVAGPDVLLVGDAGNATLSWDGVPMIGADLLRGRWGRAWDGLNGLAGRQHRSVAMAAAAQLLGPVMPRAVRRWRAQRAAGALSRWATYSMVSADFLDRLNYESAARATGHDIPFAGDGDRRAARLRNVQTRARRDGGAARRHRSFDVRDPYADRRLVEFTLGIPESQYMRGGENRWLARRVLADRLPVSVTRESRRGLQCPEWYDVVTARRDDMIAAVERIEGSPLASRVVDVPRMKALLDDWPADAEAAMARKQVFGHALQRGVAIGGFLRWYEGGNG
jgi:asparagine synthase (glutamine-hydrolysing)